MLKVNAIKPTKNPEVVTVELEEVQSPLDILRGFNRPKKAFITASKDNTFKEGMTVAGRIEAVKHEGPQYEGHKPFEKNGCYYTMKVVD